MHSPHLQRVGASPTRMSTSPQGGPFSPDPAEGMSPWAHKAPSQGTCSSVSPVVEDPRRVEGTAPRPKWTFHRTPTAAGGPSETWVLRELSGQFVRLPHSSPFEGVHKGVLWVPQVWRVPSCPESRPFLHRASHGTHTGGTKAIDS